MPITINGSGSITGLSVGGLPDGSITNDDLASNAVSTNNILNGAVTLSKLGPDEQSGLCKAWVNFDGTGTVAIRASYNVSSITDNGTGSYTVNFTTALADADYTYSAGAAQSASSTGMTTGAGGDTVFSSSSFRLQFQGASNNVAIDVTHGTVAIFR